MRDWGRGMFARSLAGHDKGRLYLVLETGDGYVLLTDGRYHPFERPKKKNRIHVQPVCAAEAVKIEELPAESGARNAAVRNAIHAKEEDACQRLT